MPLTKLGKWSVGLNTFFLIAVVVSIVLVVVLHALSFEDHWWDATVPVLFLISMTAFITGIIAVKKNKDHSMMVKVSIITGICVILFVLLHSLFISD